MTHSGPLNWTQACALRSLSEQTGWTYGWDIAARNTLGALVRRGLIEKRDISLDTEYRITYAGRVYLEEHPVVCTTTIPLVDVLNCTADTM